MAIAVKKTDWSEETEKYCDFPHITVAALNSKNSVTRYLPLLKGLSHEIDFKNVDENGQILALTRAAAGFWIFRRLLWFLIEIKHQFPVKCLNDTDSLCSPINFVTELPASLPTCRLFQRKIEVSNFLWCAATPPDYYCTSVNTTWRTAGLIHDFLERAEPMPTFFTWYQYYDDSEQ
jgi:hypothetical protein